MPVRSWRLEVAAIVFALAALGMACGDHYTEQRPDAAPAPDASACWLKISAKCTEVDYNLCVPRSGCVTITCCGNTQAYCGPDTPSL